MDKWINNPNVVRIVALVFAILLWALVQLDRNDLIDQQNQSPYHNQERMISDVQVMPIGLDEEQYALQLLEPGYVNITLKGRGRDIDQVNLNRDQHQIAVDLSEFEEGEHAGVPILPVGFPDGVEVEIYPRTARVVLEEIVGKEVPIVIELEGEPAPGLVAGDPMFDPGRVLVTLPENELSRVVAVRATLDISGASEEVIKERKVVAIDVNGAVVENAELSPSVVRVEVPITSPFITVPLPVRMHGEPASGYSVDSVKQDISEVTIFGSEEVLSQYEFYGDLEIDISGIKESTSYTLDVPVDQSLQRVHPNEITVKVNVTQSNTMTFKDIPLLLNGENEQAETIFMRPADGTIDVMLEGSPSRLNQLSLDNIRAVVDVSNLPPGTYELPVRLNTPQYIRYAGGSSLTVTVQIRQDGEEDNDQGDGDSEADEVGAEPAPSEDEVDPSDGDNANVDPSSPDDEQEPPEQSEAEEPEDQEDEADEQDQENTD